MKLWASSKLQIIIDTLTEKVKTLTDENLKMSNEIKSHEEFDYKYRETIHDLKRDKENLEEELKNLKKENEDLKFKIDILKKCIPKDKMPSIHKVGASYLVAYPNEKEE